MKMKRRNQLKNSLGYVEERPGDGYACERNDESGLDETCHYHVYGLADDH